MAQCRGTFNHQVIQKNYEDCSNERWVIQGPKGSKIRVDFLDFQTEGCCDRVLLVDGIPTKSDLGYPYNIDPDAPYCQDDYYYYYDYDYYDYYDYYRDEDDDENKTVQKHKTRNKQSKRKEQVSSDQNRGLVSKNSKIGNQGTNK